MTHIYIPDTNIISAFIKQNPLVFENIGHALVRGDEIYLCPVVYHEIYRGLLYRDTKRLLADFLNLIDNTAIQPFTQDDWTEASVMWAEMRRTGNTVGEMDILIAAYAKMRNAIVVTNNEKHFIPLGVPVENWLHKKEWLQKDD
ncbi:MAG: PIN domain-containing protein [Chloroflexota bacterium]